MITFDLFVTDYLETAFTDLCSVKGTHLTLAVYNRKLFLAAIAPEFYKIYTDVNPLDTPDFSIRLEKTMLKSLIEYECTLHFVINEDISIRKIRNNSIKINASFPLEYDYNKELIITAAGDGNSCKNEYDLSALIGMRPMLPYSSTGLQFKNNLAYIHGNGFIVYCHIEHPCEFIMSATNIAELIALIRACGRLQIYNSGIYTVFKKGGVYLGCKQPVRFVDSLYTSYEVAVPLTETKANLCELCSTLKSIVPAKGESLNCIFDFEHLCVDVGVYRGYKLSVSMSNDNKSIDISGGISKDIGTVSVPLDVLKCILSNTKLKFNDVHIIIYDSFITFRVGNLDILLSRSD